LSLVRGGRWWEWVLVRGTNGGTTPAAPGGAHLRVINAAESLILAQVLILGVFSMHSEAGLPRMWRLLPFIILPVLVYLQHRTVWIVVLGTMVVTGWLSKRLRVKLLFLALSCALVVGSLSVLENMGIGLNKVEDLIQVSATERVEGVIRDSASDDGAQSTQDSTVDSNEDLIQDSASDSEEDSLLGSVLEPLDMQSSTFSWRLEG
jgi:hypothetical protein